MSAFDWHKLETCLPGCTHAAIDPFGMLVVMKAEVGMPFFHQSNRWIPGDEGVRKEYGLLGVGGSADFNAAGTLEANPNRGAEIRAAVAKAAGSSQTQRGAHANVAPSPMHAPSLHAIKNDKSLQTGNIQNQPAVVDGVNGQPVETGPAPAQESTLNELGLDPAYAATPSPELVMPDQHTPAASACNTTPNNTTPNVDPNAEVVDIAITAIDIATAYTLIHGPAEKNLEIAEMKARLKELTS